MQKDIKVKTFLLIIGILAILEAVLIFTFLGKNNLCKKAICNEDNSMCYVYELDNSGKTTIKWRGSCQK